MCRIQEKDFILENELQPEVKKSFILENELQSAVKKRLAMF